MNEQLGVVRRLGKGAGGSEQGDCHATGAPAPREVFAGISDSLRSSTEAVRFQAVAAWVYVRSSCAGLRHSERWSDRGAGLRYLGMAAVLQPADGCPCLEARNFGRIKGLKGPTSIKGLFAQTSKLTALLQGITPCRG